MISVPNCRSLRELEWRIDRKVIRSLLTPRPHTAFEMLLEGRTREEAQNEIGVYGGSFYRKILEPIQSVVTACGYGTQEGSRNLLSPPTFSYPSPVGMISPKCAVSFW